ncbi:MAG: hypothetical protein RLZZ444_1732, partial [Pseudomonadota bacterium]
CLLTGALLAMVRKRIGLHAPIALLALAGLVVIDALLLVRVLSEGPVTMVLGRWLPPFGIAFTVDLLGASFALVAALVALAAALYGARTVGVEGQRHGFYPFVLFLMAGVSGAFLTGDIFNLYVWFEVLLISSFGLLILGGSREQIDGAVKYGLLNLVGTTLFLIATGYLYAIFGTLNMADIASRAAVDHANLPLGTLATLYFLAFAMKAAAFPVNFWLPASYHTPKIVVSALFGGLLTKVGVYALLRVLVMLLPANGASLNGLVAIVAIATLLVGGLGSIAQSDIRRALGYMVISGIGIMLAGLAIGGEKALAAVIFYGLHSMVVMAALYFMAGMAGRLAGFDLTRMGGLYAAAPGFSAMALMLFLSVAGLPPFSGFWPKAELVSAAIGTGHGWLAGTILLSGFLTTFAAGRIFILGFWRPAETALEPFAPPAGTIPALVFLVALTIGFGLWPEPLMILARQAAEGLVDPAAYFQSVFPGAGA